MVEYNKFLHKWAAATAGGSGIMDKARNLVDQGKKVMSDAADEGGEFFKLYSASGLGVDRTAATGLYNALKRLDDYKNNKHSAKYNPLADMDTVQKVFNRPEFRKTYSERYAANPNSKLLSKLKPVYDKADAMRYAVQNPKYFKQMQGYKNMDTADIIFDSAEGNYNFMRNMRSPLAAFASADQRKAFKDNYGWLKFMWRLKKFFSEFGNWRSVPEPEDAVTR